MRCERLGAGGGWWGLGGGRADPAEAELPATGPGRMKLNVKIEQQPRRRETKLIFVGEKSLLPPFYELKAYLSKPVRIFL